MVANTRPRNSLGTMRKSCDMLSTELIPTPARESAMKSQRRVEVAHLAEEHVSSAVHHVADHDGALVIPEAEPAADAVGRRPADSRPTPAQPQMTPSPEGPRLKTISPNTLNRICAAPPPEAQPTLTISEPQNQRHAAHVAQALGVFVPGAHHLGFVERAGRRNPRPGRIRREMQPRRYEERQGVEGEGPPVAECATLMPASRAPMVRVVHWVVWVSELAVCSSSRVAMEGRIEARPAVKNGEAAISSALSR